MHPPPPATPAPTRRPEIRTLSGTPACYRFCLADPAVQIVLSAPTSVPELRQNLAVLASPAPSPDDLARLSRFGDLVHGDGRGSFDTEWA